MTLLIATEIGHKCQAWKGLLLVKEASLYQTYKQRRNDSFTVLSSLWGFEKAPCKVHGKLGGGNVKGLAKALN